MKASDLFVKALENEGVEYIFGIPGEENLDFLESLRGSKIKLILTRHEQAAGFMAATYGRLSGKTGVCLSTLGPGATNFVTPAAYAQLGGMPMLMITGQKPIKSSKQGNFQIVKVVDMMRPLTKFTQQIVHGNTIPSLVRKAFKMAEEERPGATHLEFPEDIAREMTDFPLLEPHKVRRAVAEEKAIHRAVEMIEEAKSPLVLIGADANRKLTSKMLTEFITKTGIPFFNTQMGKGVVDEMNDKFLGTAALSSKDYVHCAIEKADLIINVGHDSIEKPPFIMEESQSRKVIHINFFSATIDEIYFPQHEVVGDIANAIWQIKEMVSKQQHWNFEHFMKVKEEVDRHLLERADDDSFPMSPRRIVADVRKAMPSDGIVTLDNGMYKIWFARHYKACQPNTLLLDNALATMGAGLPSAIGAKICRPDKKVLSVSGDGGFMMNSQEIETAVRLKLDLVMIVLNDNAYGMIKWKQQGMGLPDFGLDYQNPNFLDMANSFGAKGHRVEAANELLGTINEAFDAGGVHLIEVPIDYSDNVEVLIKELEARVCPL